MSVRAATACVVPLILTLAGCTKFDHPIIDESGPALDQRLVGRWVLENDEGRYEIEVRRDGDAGFVHPLLVEGNAKNDPDQPVDMRLITARLGNLDFGSAIPADGAETGWSLFRYEMHDDRLTIFFSNDEFWRGAVTDHRIAGAIEKSHDIVTAHVTAPGDELGRFLLGYAPVGFPDDPEPEFVFERAH